MAKLGSKAPEMMRYVVMLGSVREGRMADRVASFLVKKLRETRHEVVLFDPMEMQFTLVNKPVHWYSNRAEAPPWLRDAEKMLESADGFVIVSSEYNGTIPPALSNMLDHFGPNVFNTKPASIISYSQDPFGGIQARSQLIHLLLELQAIVVPTACCIPAVHTAIDASGVLLDPSVEQKALKLINQQDWYAAALKLYRTSHEKV